MLSRHAKTFLGLRARAGAGAVATQTLNNTALFGILYICLSFLYCAEGAVWPAFNLFARLALVSTRGKPVFETETTTLQAQQQASLSVDMSLLDSQLQDSKFKTWKPWQLKQRKSKALSPKNSHRACTPSLLRLFSSHFCTALFNAPP